MNKCTIQTHDNGEDLTFRCSLPSKECNFFVKPKMEGQDGCEYSRVRIHKGDDKLNFHVCYCDEARVASASNAMEVLRKVRGLEKTRTVSPGEDEDCTSKLTPARKLTSRFFMLPWHERVGVLDGFLSPEEMRKADGATLAKGLKCAIAKGKLEELRAEVDRRYSEGVVKGTINAVEEEQK